MQRKPINLFTYALGFGSGLFALSNHNLLLLILSIVLFFHAFMSCNIIDDGKTP